MCYIQKWDIQRQAREFNFLCQLIPNKFKLVDDINLNFLEFKQIISVLTPYPHYTAY